MTEETKPNIVFFIVDQLSAKWLEGQSNIACPTPNIDKLRETGVAFSQTFSSNPVCMPTRATIATGLSTRGHGVLQNGYELDSDIPTFMTMLKNNGWKTGAFGKIHLHSHYDSLYPDYTPYGWDEVYNTEDPRGGAWLDWVEKEHPEYYEKALATVWTSGVTGLRKYGKKKIDIAAKAGEIRRRFEWGSQKYPQSTHSMYTLPFPKNISQTEWITQNAINFIEDTPPDQPLYAHISYVQPHLPSCPPEECMSLVDPAEIPAPIPPEWPNDKDAPKCLPLTEGATSSIPDNWRKKRWYYLADVAHLDQQLGRVIESLEDTGRLENTHIIFLSDHGEMLLDHGFTAKAERHYDACIRVPLIISGPGSKRGLDCTEIVQLEDIFPTVLEMAGIPVPKPNVMRQVQGMEDLESSAGIYDRSKIIDQLTTICGNSLRGLCTGKETTSRRKAAYSESYNNIDSFDPTYWARTIRTKEWRYTLYPRGGGEQLFDLKNDPDELHNLAGDQSHSKTKQELRGALMELIIEQDYPHTTRGLYALGAH